MHRIRIALAVSESTAARISATSAVVMALTDGRWSDRFAGNTCPVSNNVDVQRGASETGSASAQVLAAAQSLSSESTRLKHEVSKFLNAVRAA
jgi:hypothetical protein